MKISASIYSNKNATLEETITGLDNQNVDMLHIDCNDSISVIDDIKSIKKISDKLLDLHLITPNPTPFYEQLKDAQVDYLTIQYEEIEGDIKIPSYLTGEKGLAITSNTSIDVFEKYKDQFDYILIMATTPGQSGGAFNAENFQKIRAFHSKYPTKKVHVDGGVNGEVSFILRNMGVYSSVSGSYLFNSKTIDSALINLKHNEFDSHFKVKDFMRPVNKNNCIIDTEFTFKSTLQSIEDGNIGFTSVVDNNNILKGIISNADVRKGLIQNFDSIENITLDNLINSTPVTIDEEKTVSEMLQLIKSKNFPIMYLPVINTKNNITGIVSFINLIKGEL